MSAEPWPPAREAKLRELLKHELTATEIAVQLGLGRDGRNAVIGKVHRMGLSLPLKGISGGRFGRPRTSIPNDEKVVRIERLRERREAEHRLREARIAEANSLAAMFPVKHAAPALRLLPPIAPLPAFLPPRPKIPAMTRAEIKRHAALIYARRKARANGREVDDEPDVFERMEAEA